MKFVYKRINWLCQAQACALTTITRTQMAEISISHTSWMGYNNQGTLASKLAKKFTKKWLGRKMVVCLTLLSFQHPCYSRWTHIEHYRLLKSRMVDLKPTSTSSVSWNQTDIQKSCLKVSRMPPSQIVSLQPTQTNLTWSMEIIYSDPWTWTSVFKKDISGVNFRSWKKSR
mgnify:CR=1 FL=1